MMNALQSEQPHSPSPGSKRITLTTSQASQHNFEDFVTPNTGDLLSCLHIGCDFLDGDPDTWAERDGFKQGRTMINKLLVKNDIAE